MSDYMGVICYHGNKEKLLPKIAPLFPERKRFVDAFCGGLSVTLGVSGDVLANDYDPHLIALYNALQCHPDPIGAVESYIAKYGLDAKNKEAYFNARSAFNNSLHDPMLHLTLLQHSFSNMNRFNQKGEFNATFGRRTFSDNGRERIRHFQEQNKQRNIEFHCGHYLTIDIQDGDFVYVDPPYWITAADYNKFWDEDEEADLYKFLDDLNSQGIKFGLSNVTHHKGKTNNLLLDFIKHGGYSEFVFDKKYVLDRSGGNNGTTREVYVTNAM